MVVPAEKEPQSARGYFELFQLEPCFDLDVEVLGQRFRTLQREFHPDRYAGRPASEQRVAAQLSADINEAFDALRDPVRRAGYLLERQGLDLAKLERTPVAGDFLIQQMQLRERLEDANPERRDAFGELQREIGLLLDTEFSRFRRAMADNQHTEAGIAWVHLLYLEKLRLELARKEAT